MSTFENQIITDDGGALIKSALLGGKLTFTRMELTDGKVVLSTGIDTIKENGDGLQISTTFSTIGNAAGFWASTLKLYAQGSDDVEVLFSTATDSSPDYVPAEVEAVLTFGFSVTLAIKKTDNISFAAITGKLVTVEMLNDALGNQPLNFSTDSDGNIVFNVKE